MVLSSASKQTNTSETGDKIQILKKKRGRNVTLEETNRLWNEFTHMVMDVYDT